MLGRELLTSKDPLKEINFGGVSVIFRFHDDIQISIFVRNLTSHNYVDAEKVITNVVGEILDKHIKHVSSFDLFKQKTYESVRDITLKLKDANQSEEESPVKDKEHSEAHEVLIYGSEKDSQDRLVKFLDKKSDLKVTSTSIHEEALKILNTLKCGVVLLDSQLPDDGGDTLFFAEHAKEISPFVQVIYRARDRRASSPLITALNSGFINFLIPYKLSRKRTLEWTIKGLEKAAEIEEQSKSGEAIDQALDQAAIARTMIRGNLEQYNSEDVPELHGIFIFKDITPIFQIFWEHQESKITFDEEMMAGLVSSLDSVGGEMFFEEDHIGGLELGGAKIIVRHSEDIKVAFFVKHLDPNTSVVVNKLIGDVAIRIFKIIADENRKFNSYKIKARFDTLCNNMYSEFLEQFSQQ
ncbi:MAG: hypothetical protein ACW967_07565, partial [Candidatus Hodarchaeales archaeon]|jgi:hypothetical protein